MLRPYHWDIDKKGSWYHNPECGANTLMCPTNISDPSHIGFSFMPSREIIACYKELVLASFEQINASWITYNTLCNPHQFGWYPAREQVENLQETHLEVYSGSKCTERFPEM